MPKTSKKTNRGADNSFIKALGMGLAATTLTWLLLTLIFSLIMVNMSDPSSVGVAFSMIPSIVGVFAGGFASAKKCKKNAFVLAVVLVALVLAITYSLSGILDLTRNLGPIMKTVNIAAIATSCVFGAKLGSDNLGKGSSKRHIKR